VPSFGFRTSKRQEQYENKKFKNQENQALTNITKYDTAASQAQLECVLLSKGTKKIRGATEAVSASLRFMFDMLLAASCLAGARLYLLHAVRCSFTSPNQGEAH